MLFCSCWCVHDADPFLVHALLMLRILQTLMAHESFIFAYVSTLEQSKNFVMHDRVHVASLLMVVLQENPTYCFHVLEVSAVEEVVCDGDALYWCNIL
jgi:hypothetical protein